MYAWLFSRLPGPVWVRILLAVVLVAAVVWILFELIFPLVAPYSPFTTEVTLPDP
ncbi:hypothetical protein [Kocuria sp. U4B]